MRKEITDQPGTFAGWGWGGPGPGGPCGFIGIAIQPIIIIIAVARLAMSRSYRRVYRDRQREVWKSWRCG